jgi:hypothetical protein
MTKEGTNGRRNEPIFPARNSAGGEIKRSVHVQNIGDVVPGVSREVSDYLNSHYGSRGGALDWSRSEVGLLVPERTPRIQNHADYLGATAGRPLNVWEKDDLQNGHHHHADTLVVPYIHAERTQRTVREMGQESWGLPPAMVARLKNKVSFHEAVREVDVEGFEVPEYKVASLQNLDKVAKNVLKESESLYAEHGLSGVYPRGVVIRADESDGNYGGNVIIHENGKGIKVVINGKPLTEVIDGKEVPKAYRRGEWGHALRDSKKILEKSIDKGAKPEFVVSRYMDLADSPGLSLVVNRGYVETLGWNKQVQAKGTTACIGTEKYSTDNPHLKRLQAAYEDKTADDFRLFLEETAKKLNIPFEEISGVINVDIMLPGALEAELRKRRGQPDGYYLAESNARFTNYTDAVMAVVGLTGLTPSPREIQSVVWQGVTSVDRQPIGEARIEAVREELYRIDQAAKEGGDPNRAFMRMPDSPAGIILTGNRKEAQKKVDLAVELAKGGVVFEALKPTVKAGNS